MCEKFLNQTDSNAALPECTSDWLIYDIIHDFGVVEESQSPLPDHCCTSNSTHVLHKKEEAARGWGQVSLREVSFGVNANFAAYIKCIWNKCNIFFTFVLFSKGVLVALEHTNEAGMTDSQYEWKYRRRLNVSASNNRIIKAVRARGFQHECMKATITPKPDGI